MYMYCKFALLCTLTGLVRTLMTTSHDDVTTHARAHVLSAYRFDGSSIASLRSAADGQLISLSSPGVGCKLSTPPILKRNKRRKKRVRSVKVDRGERALVCGKLDVLSRCVLLLILGFFSRNHSSLTVHGLCLICIFNVVITCHNRRGVVARTAPSAAAAMATATTTTVY